MTLPAQEQHIIVIKALLDDYERPEGTPEHKLALLGVVKRQIGYLEALLAAPGCNARSSWHIGG